MWEEKTFVSESASLTDDSNGGGESQECNSVIIVVENNDGPFQQFKL